MPNIIINGETYQVEDGLTLIQVCDMFNIQIPRFCYHEKLSPVGSCRMCLVELKGSKKLIPACTTNVSEGMEIITESDPIDKSRKIMLELLLVNHPLDCPICDKGGECDLQDQTYRYGIDRSYVNDNKRAVEDKNFGPLIDAYMTRCIHCTRCIRFAKEIAGVEDLGGIGRGDFTEIETYVNHTLSSELSGNLADVCPVGALTNSNYAYKARPWELISTETIDIMDALGSNIKVDCSPLSVLRILPKLNEDINEEWISDKARYITDAIKVQRLDTPMVRKNGVLTSVSWDEALLEIKNNFLATEKNKIAVLSGDFVDVETLYSMKKLMHSLDVYNLDCRDNDIAFDYTNRSDYLFNTSISGIEESDFCLLVGTNPRYEAPLLNARIRKRYLQGNYSIALIGEKVDLTYNYDYLDSNSAILKDILNGNHIIVDKIKKAKKPMLILGLGALKSENTQQLLNLCKNIANKYNFNQESWNGFNVLQTSTSIIGGLEVGFTPKDINQTSSNIIEHFYDNRINFLWLLNYDKINIDKIKKNHNPFIVYQGHHGDKGASVANVILPGALWLEKSSTYVNLEGRMQRSYKCVPTIGEAKEDWKIIKRFSQIVNKEIPFNTLQELQLELKAYKPEIFSNSNVLYNHLDAKTIDDTNIKGTQLLNIINNYYLTDVITNNSVKMIECSSLFLQKKVK